MYPFDRFSEDSKAVLTLSQAEAERAGHSYIGTEHLLLGLMQRQQGMAAIALTNLGLRYPEIQEDVHKMLQGHAGERMKLDQLIPTSRVKKVIEMSFEEARQESLAQVETGHLLLGLMLEGQGIAAHVLTDRGVTVEQIRTQIEALRKSGKAESSATGPPPIRRHLDLTDESGRAIAVDILFPAGYPREQQETLAQRISVVVEKGGTT